jgi:hypothetical protein
MAALPFGQHNAATVGVEDVALFATVAHFAAPMRLAACQRSESHCGQLPVVEHHSAPQPAHALVVNFRGGRGRGRGEGRGWRRAVVVVVLFILKPQLEAYTGSPSSPGLAYLVCF